MGFRVFFRQGSFALAELCDSWDEALAHAAQVQLRRGVWLVRVEHADGRRIRGGYDVPSPVESLTAIGPKASPSINGMATSVGDVCADDDELSLPLPDFGRWRASAPRYALGG